MSDRMWLQKMAKRYQRRWPVLGVLFLGFALTVGLYLALNEREARMTRMRFDALAEDRLRVLERRSQDVFGTVPYLAGYFGGAGHVSWSTFESYTQSLLDHRAGLRLLLWAPRVTAAQRSSFESAALSLGDSSFQITEQHTPGNLIPAGERDEYFPIYYLTSFEVHAPLWGMDLAAHPPTRRAIARARENGVLTATAPIVLLSNLGEIHTIWVFQAVYESHDQPTEDQPTQEQHPPVRGIVAGVVQPARMMQAIRSATSQRDMALEIRDADAPPAYNLIYKSPTTDGNGSRDSLSDATGSDTTEAKASWRIATVSELADAVSSSSNGPAEDGAAEGDAAEGDAAGNGDANGHSNGAYHTHMDIAGRTWQVTATPTEAFIRDRQSWAPPIVLVGGTIITTLLALYLARVLSHTQLVEAQVASRTGELRNANETLHRTNEALRRSNQALQEFAYIVSHDLQEPLRKVRGFGDMLASEANGGFTREQRDYLQRMQNAAIRMQALIDGLLNYARVTTQARAFEVVDLTTIARQVVADLEIRLRETDGQVQIDELPAVDADPLQMRQLLQNLIGNALKFHKPDVPPYVHVHGECLSDGTARIEVTDNGIGFESDDAARLFQPFQRLHDPSTFDGTGMGLAVCQRIVERHDGSITAHSQPGEGSTFTFTLPCHRQQTGDPDNTIARQPDHESHAQP